MDSRPVEMFSDARLALVQECSQHPDLMEKLEGIERTPEGWSEMIAEMAAHVMIGLDGAYMPHELERLYDIVTWKLRKKRQLIVDAVTSSRVN